MGQQMTDYDDDDDGGVTFLLAPCGISPLCRAHEAEAERSGAEFGNYGAYTGKGVIVSKTTKGILTSVEKDGEVRHHGSHTTTSGRSRISGWARGR
jgi:hypothetical protein